MNEPPAAPAPAREEPDPTRTRVESALEGIAHRWCEARDGMPSIEVAPGALHATLARLRERAAFEMITLVTAVDRSPAEPRFEVIHQLLSLEHDDRLRIRTRLDGEAPHLATCTDLWPGAAFMERECFDMFGVVFEGHPNLERLLMPAGYGHHPLRKDFPHHGIEPDRLYREWDRERRKSWPGKP